MKALVLDDEPTYRDYLKRSLERQGLRICVAADPEAAQKIVQETGIDLMIVDIKLASAIDGLEFAEWVRKQDCDAALIVITGYSSPEYERRSQDLGAIAYLEKPFDLRELEPHVQHVLERRKLLREIQRLEQELATGREAQAATRVLSDLPLVCIAPSGELLFATEGGRAALDAVTDPAQPRPLQRGDEVLLRRLQEGLSSEGGGGWVTVEGHGAGLENYRTFVWATRWKDCQALGLLFVGEKEVAEGTIDELWVDILLRASRALGRAGE